MSENREKNNPQHSNHDGYPRAPYSSGVRALIHHGENNQKEVGEGMKTESGRTKKKKFLTRCWCRWLTLAGLSHTPSGLCLSTHEL